MPPTPMPPGRAPLGEPRRPQQVDGPPIHRVLGHDDVMAGGVEDVDETGSEVE